MTDLLMDRRSVRLNESEIRRSKPPAAGNVIRYDTEVPGFGLRVTAAGARSFVLNYRCDGRERRLTIGTWPAWSATAGRERAKELRRQIDQGIDPLAARSARRGALTVATLVKDYIEHYAKAKKHGGREDARILRVNVLPVLGTAKAEEVHRRDIVRLLDPIAKRAPVMANRTLAVVRRLFNNAVERGTLELSPCVRVKPPGGRERSRERTLSNDEVRTLWTRLDTARMDRRTAAAFRLILVTGQRPGEIRAMRWDEIEGAWWTIPSEKTKNETTHRVPLTALALELLGERAEGFVFPTRGKLGHLGDTALNHACRVNMAHFGIEPWTPHDLRRTVGTRLGELGFNRLVQDKVLNHKDRTVGGIYDRHSYDREKRQALGAWERRLGVIVLGVEESADVIDLVRP
jgi:integrase